MNNHSESGTKPENPAIQQWGLKRDITPCFGARLVQEGNRLHYLADRAGFSGACTNDVAMRLVQAFPLMMKQLELMLTSGELNPRHAHCVTLYHNGLTCEADTLGSCGYVYIAIYPEQTEPQYPPAYSLNISE
ncbi:MULTISPECIES: type IV toxin-antitoxin system YeeU family antitoxin [Citrobacter]|uniref:type IV toxin-antitoxin system YeeU family antitoxin n=1 Tax=Citrobacter TaxID=544 RepID=UPI001A2B7DCE|nr:MULTISPECIES: type IV toxin-antitoxin system YeeU family antitoxin [unclassified Citrobacter]EJR2183151.1 type IV toxin-antitoxin system YeeU family antitoxin [Escherichia coli]HAZ3445415.1 type IV toxin-antitoxin system YeeU family antitoxin [Citrobacter freundii]